MKAAVITRVVYLPGLPAHVANELAARTGTDCTAKHEGGCVYTVSGLSEAVDQLVEEADPYLSGLARLYDSVPVAIMSLNPS